MNSEVRAKRIRAELTRLASAGATFSVNELRILLVRLMSKIERLNYESIR
jgi:hypothetical protein